MRGVETFYGKIQALKGVDIDVNEGEIVTLIGANGAGKSTTMMTIFGSPRARKGRSCSTASDITGLPTHQIARMSIAQSPEGRRIFPRMTVFENLQMGASIDNFAHFDEDLERVFAMFPRLKERAQQRGGTLSGGEQQMLAIARALMSRPRLLLLDEPSLGLAPLIVKQIFNVDRRSQPHAGPVGVPGRAERLSRAEARPSRLCHGQRRDHDAGHRRRSCSRGPKCAPPISREATDAAAGFGPIRDYGLLAFCRARRSWARAGGLATGRAFATSWSPRWLIVAGDDRARGGRAVSAFRAVSGGSALAALLPRDLRHPARSAAAFGYRVDARAQMATQYSWAFERAELWMRTGARS